MVVLTWSKRKSEQAVDFTWFDGIMITINSHHGMCKSTSKHEIGTLTPK